MLKLSKIITNQNVRIGYNRLLYPSFLKLKSIIEDEKISSCYFDFTEWVQKIIFLGGDHSISYSLGKAFFEHCEKENKEPCLIIFDAHADCIKPMKEPTHEEWLRALIDEGFPKENIFPKWKHCLT